MQYLLQILNIAHDYLKVVLKRNQTKTCWTIENIVWSLLAKAPILETVCVKKKTMVVVREAIILKNAEIYENFS